MVNYLSWGGVVVVGIISFCGDWYTNRETFLLRRRQDCKSFQGVGKTGEVLREGSG